jgi:putative ABC transport system ATP-binding protein
VDLTGTPVLSVEGLTRRFRRGAETVTALDTVSLRLHPGEVTVAAGPSGSGKTTLLSILAGLDRQYEGSVVTHPPLPSGVPPHRVPWRDLAFVPQALGLLDELTVAENVDLPARLGPGGGRLGRDGGRADRDRPVEALLDLLEIGQLADRYPALTSGGEQQRTAIARALRLRPAVLLCDEPTGHQDRERVDLVLAVLRQHAYAGNAVLLTSHDEAVIAGADRVVRLADGRLVADSRRAHFDPPPSGKPP